ncbi:hypothetical protein [Clostridium botulinum]|uniref:hypothetical protein n=1 Tax=Clostridium botulinum TaxID=1491 RepID=UPI000AE31C40|nr:hypothetical protein [Clostridium botulinum]
MAIKNIEIQDSDGNIYYPHTNASVVKNGESTVAEQLKDIANDSYPIVESTGTNIYVGFTARITSLAKGTKFTLFVGNNASGNCTVNLNNYGAKNIKDSFGNIVNNLKANIPYNLCYNGSDFILQGKGGGGNATIDKVLSASTFTNDSGPQTGTMPNQGTKTATLNCGGSYIIPSGYHNGSGKVTANSLASQTQGNATAAQIIAGFSAWVNGSKINGNATIESLGGIRVASGKASLDNSNIYTKHSANIGFTPTTVYLIHSGGKKAYINTFGLLPIPNGVSQMQYEFSNDDGYIRFQECPFTFDKIINNRIRNYYRIELTSNGFNFVASNNGNVTWYALKI